MLSFWPLGLVVPGLQLCFVTGYPGQVRSARHGVMEGLVGSAFVCAQRRISGLCAPFPVVFLSCGGGLKELSWNPER